MEQRTIEFEDSDSPDSGCTMTLTGPRRSVVLLHSWDEDGSNWKELIPAVALRDWLNANLPQ